MVSPKCKVLILSAVCGIWRSGAYTYFLNSGQDGCGRPQSLGWFLRGCFVLFKFLKIKTSHITNFINNWMYHNVWMSVRLSLVFISRPKINILYKGVPNHPASVVLKWAYVKLSFNWNSHIFTPKNSVKLFSTLKNAWSSGNSLGTLKKEGRFCHTSF